MHILGIDLGTTNSLVSWWREGEQQLAPNPLGSLLTPSAVSIDETGEVLIGDAAIDRLVTHPDRSAALFKRRMGSNGTYSLAGRDFRPEELSSLVLRQLVRDAEHHFGETFKQVVISVPAYFNDSQRNATRAAGELAGLTVKRLINEPTAAAMAYGLHAQPPNSAHTASGEETSHGNDNGDDEDDEQTILVVDLGGGTLDVSVLEFFDGVMEVHASTGDNYLGGEDFDTALRSHTLEQWAVDEQAISHAASAILRRSVTAARHHLSNAHEATIHPPDELNKLASTTLAPITISRDAFDSLVEPLLTKLRKTIERAVRDSKMDINELSQVVLVGGATRMPIVRNLVGRLFGRIPLSTLNPDEVVAIGASVQGALEAKDAALTDRVLTDVCPYSLGVQVASEQYEYAHSDGRFLPIIERNTTIPVSRVETLVPVAADQTAVRCKIYQGESRLVSNNVRLGELEVPLPRPNRLTRVKKYDAREESIDVRFTYDTNGILEVQATLASTGESTAVVLRLAESALSDAEIAKRLKELESLKVHPRDDALNIAILARAHRLFEERLGDDRTSISQAIDRYEQILASQDLEAIADARKQFGEYLDHLEEDVFQ